MRTIEIIKGKIQADADQNENRFITIRVTHRFGQAVEEGSVFWAINVPPDAVFKLNDEVVFFLEVKSESTGS